jgi:hypothetical protein
VARLHAELGVLSPPRYRLGATRDSRLREHCLAHRQRLAPEVVTINLDQGNHPLSTAIEM